MTAPQPKAPALPARPEAADGPTIARLWGRELRPNGCAHCGSTHLVAGDEPVLCPSCAQAQLEAQPARVRTAPPELVVPFGVAPDALASQLRAWVGKVRLRPDDLTADKIAARLQRAYIPMWLVDGTVRASWEAELGFDYEVATAQEAFHDGAWQSRKITETRIRWEPRAGTLQRRYDNRRVPALADHASVLERLGAFDFERAVAYEPEMLAAAAVQLPDMPPEEVWHLAEPVFARAAAGDCASAGGAQHIRDFKLDAEYAELEWTQLLLPVYAAYYRDDEGNAIPVVINGQSGRLYGALRASMRRAWRWSAAIGAVAALLFVVGAFLALLAAFVPPALAAGAVLVAASLAVGVAAAGPVIYAARWNARNRA